MSLEAASKFAAAAEFAERNGWTLSEDLICSPMEHPYSYKDHECLFASSRVPLTDDMTLLDVGSYQQFVIGLSAAWKVTHLDARPAPAHLHSSSLLRVTGQAQNMQQFDDCSFSIVTSLSAIEHFGLGRYGDQLCLNADALAVKEMIRVLQPEGSLILTTTCTAGPKTLVFDAHRVYNTSAIMELTEGLKLVSSSTFSRRNNAPCSIDELSKTTWDVFCGHWIKP